MKSKSTLFTVLLLLLFTLPSFAQQTVSGLVKSAETGEPIPMVSVSEKGGSGRAVVTNIDGKFDIGITTSNPVLVFKGPGGVTKEVTVGSNRFLVVELGMATQALGEVKIVALGQERSERSLGFGVEEVGGELVQQSGEVNVVSGLSAKVSGVQVTNSSGASGAASYIKIRGNATFQSGDNQPLFVIDGVPVDNAQSGTEDLRSGVSYSNRAIDINPDDIANVSVLKGGAAAALYGTRGANGVILITTKKGSFNEGFSVNYSSSYELTQVNKLPGYQTTYAQGYGGVYGGGTTNPFSWGPAIADLPGVESYNNPEIFFQNGSRINNAVNVTAGTQNTSVYLSLSNLKENGVVPTNSFSRTTLRLTGTAKLSNSLKATASVSYSNSGGRRVQQGSNTSGLMLGLFRTPASFDNSNGVTDPTDPAAYLNPDGTQRNYRSGFGYDNPYWTINQNPFQDKVNRTFGYFKLDYVPFEWLSLHYRVGLDTYADRRNQIFAINSRTLPNGRIINDQWNYLELNQDITANLHKKYGKLDAGLLVGMNTNQRNRDNVYQQGDGLVISEFYNMSNASTQIAAQTMDRRRISGYYGELSLGWDNYLFLTMTARRDQASTFGDVSTSIFYPSVSLGYVFTDHLLKDNKILNYGKLRASWAKVGIEPPFGSNRTYYEQTPTGGGLTSGWINGLDFPYMGQAGFSQSNTIGNPNLRPEFTITSEIGVDLRFFDSRLTAEFTYYDQQSKDLIVRVPTASSNGYSAIYENIGQMQNRGIEILVGADIIRNDDWTWNVGVNYTRNRNKVIELAPGVDVIDLPWGFFGANQRLVVGEAYGTLYGDDWQRDGNGNALVDENGYPIYSSTEVVVGNPNPDFLLGVSSTVDYKNWSLGMVWDIRQGGDIWNGTRGALYYFGTHTDVATGRGETFVWEDVVAGNSGVYAPGTTINGVDVSGQPNTTEIVRDETSYADGPLSGFTGASRPFIEDGSWIRMRQISLSYKFDPKVFEGTFIKGLSLNVTGRNLLLFTNYTGVDPETNLSGATNSQGADYFNMPNTKGYIFGLKANF